MALADIQKPGQFSKGLSDLLEGLAWGAAWHAANFRTGNSEDAQAELLRFEECYKRMMGRVMVEDGAFPAGRRAVSGNSAFIVARQR